MKLVSSPNHHRRLYNDNLFILLAEVKAILIINNFKIEPSNYYFEPNKKTYHNYYKYAEKRLGLLNRFGQTNQRIFVIIDGYKCLVDDVCLENDSLKINSTSVEVMQNTLEDGWINFEKITKVIVE
ncbi:hypothetical protein HC864_05335 [Candidatus Gracilibacteria bacterium]|nr:hypothetical protein [Thermales bacterium]NJL97196.1 hypothetical protein [Candidatus Gracilibacteria bacterium]